MCHVAFSHTLAISRDADAWSRCQDRLCHGQYPYVLRRRLGGQRHLCFKIQDIGGNAHAAAVRASLSASYYVPENDIAQQNQQRYQDNHVGAGILGLLGVVLHPTCLVLLVSGVSCGVSS